MLGSVIDFVTPSAPYNIVTPDFVTVVKWRRLFNHEHRLCCCHFSQSRDYHSPIRASVFQFRMTLHSFQNHGGRDEAPL